MRHEIKKNVTHKKEKKEKNNKWIMNNIITLREPVCPKHKTRNTTI